MTDDRSGSPSAAAGALLEALALLYPHHAIHPDPVDPRAADLLFVPHARAPRLVVPARPRRAAGRAMLRFSVSTPRREAAVRLAAASGLAAGGTAFLRDRLALVGEGESIDDHLTEVFGEPVAVAVGVGTERANRKPVLAVFSARDGRALGFAKVGVDEVSRADVSQEARNFAELEAGVPRDIEIPQVIDASWWRGLYVLTMSSLRTRWGEPRGQRGVVPVDHMERFGGAFSRGRSALASTPFWEAVDAGAGELRDSELVDRFRQALCQSEERWGDRQVLTGAWHGDWTPWNMSWRRRRLQLWDFERFDPRAVVGMDVVHYVVNARTRAQGASDETVTSAIRACAGLHRDPESNFEAVAVSYLAAIGLRYLQGAQGLHGDRIVGRAELMVRILEGRLDGRVAFTC